MNKPFTLARHEAEIKEIHELASVELEKVAAGCGCATYVYCHSGGGETVEDAQMMD